jgi:hypothetical protein
MQDDGDVFEIFTLPKFRCGERSHQRCRRRNRRSRKFQWSRRTTSHSPVRCEVDDELYDALEDNDDVKIGLRELRYR